MKKLPVDIERKLGMIKAKGISVKITYCDVTKHWEINIGDEQFNDLIPDEHLSSYVYNRLQEVLR